MSFLPNQPLIGPILSITSLALAAPCTLLGRHYSRSLYFAQMLYIFSSVYGSTTTPPYSTNLNYSWLTFMPSFTSFYCNNGDFSCNYGYLISPALCWLAGAILIFLIMKIAGCCKRNAKFLSVYNFYKGFSYWFMPPLVYYATLAVISALQKGVLSTTTFITALIVLGVTFAVALIELIAYKAAQREEDNVWRKWLQFFCHICVSSTMVLVAINIQIGSAGIAKYLINVPLGIYMLLNLWKYKFSFKVLERIIVFIQDGAIIAAYNIFIENYSYLTTYNLDFFGLALVICLQLLILIPKFVQFCRGNGDDEDPSVNPERNEKGFDKVKRNNSFLQGDILQKQPSYEGLNNSSIGNSPRRGDNSPPRANNNPSPQRANPPPQRRR